MKPNNVNSAPRRIAFYSLFVGLATLASACSKPVVTPPSFSSGISGAPSTSAADLSAPEADEPEPSKDSQQNGRSALIAVPSAQSVLAGLRGDRPDPFAPVQTGPVSSNDLNALQLLGINGTGRSASAFFAYNGQSGVVQVGQSGGANVQLPAGWRLIAVNPSAGTATLLRPDDGLRQVIKLRG